MKKNKPDFYLLAIMTFVILIFGVGSHSLVNYSFADTDGSFQKNNASRDATAFTHQKLIDSILVQSRMANDPSSRNATSVIGNTDKYDNYPKIGDNIESNAASRASTAVLAAGDDHPTLKGKELFGNVPSGSSIVHTDALLVANPQMVGKLNENGVFRAVFDVRTSQEMTDVKVLVSSDTEKFVVPINKLFEDKSNLINVDIAARDFHSITGNVIHVTNPGEVQTLRDGNIGLP